MAKSRAVRRRSGVKPKRRQQTHHGKAKPRAGTHRRKTPVNAVWSMIFVSGAFVVALAFAFHYWQGGNYATAAKWALGMWIFFGVGVYFAICAFVLGGDADRKSPSNPIVAIEVGNTLDPSRPMETRFVLTNQNDAPIHKVWHEVSMWDARHAILVFLQPNFSETETVRPRGQLTIDGRFLGSGVAYLNNPQEIMLQITAHYLFNSTKQSTYVRFTAERRADGAYVWFPAGDGFELRPEDMPTITSSVTAAGEGRSRIVVTGITGTPAPGSEISGLLVHFTNHGDRPAKNCRFFGQMEIVPQGNLLSPFPDKTPADPGSALVEPNQPMTASFGTHGNYTFTDKDVDAFKTGDKTLYVRGRFRYEDFPGCSHWTTFAHRLRKDLTWEIDSSGNDADENDCVGPAK